MQHSSFSSEAHRSCTRTPIRPPLFPLLFFFLCFSICDSQLSAPTIGTDQLIYACANNEVVAFRGNGSLAWRATMNQTCQTNVAPVIDLNGKIYAAADQTVVVVTPPFSPSNKPVAVDFFSMVPSYILQSIGYFSSVIGLAVTSWSSVLYINTGTGIHAFMLDGTPLWSTLVQFNGSVMSSPELMGFCADNSTDCTFFPAIAVDQCDGSIYAARSDGWLYSYATWQPFLRWRYALSMDAPSSIDVVCGNNGHVYVTMPQYSTVYALSTELGTLLWQTKVGLLGETSSNVVVDSSGFVSVGSLDGFLYVISPDGTRVEKYLADSILSPVSIQISPVIDCSNEAIYVAQTKVASKTVEQLNGAQVISFTESQGMNIWMIVPSTGKILWNTIYPDLSGKTFCKTKEKILEITCSKFFFGTPMLQHSGVNKKMISLAASVTAIFLFLSILSTLSYCYWRRKQTMHRHKLYQLLRQEKFRHPKGMLLRRQEAYERTIAYLQAKLELEPQSTKIAQELKSALEGRHIVKRYLAQFSSDRNDGSHHEDWQKRPSVILSEITSDTEARNLSNSIILCIDSVLQRVCGSIKQEDFAEELRMVSSFKDELSSMDIEEIGPKMQQQIPITEMSYLSRQNIIGDNAVASSAFIGDTSAADYRNPLYNHSRSTTPSPIQKKTVTFAPVDTTLSHNQSHYPTQKRTATFSSTGGVSVNHNTHQNLKTNRTVKDRVITFSPEDEIFEANERRSSNDGATMDLPRIKQQSAMVSGPIQKRTAQRKIVTFSPVNEVFGDS